MLDVFKKIVPLSIKRSIKSVVHRKDIRLPAGPRAFVFLAADYGNIGDLAISAAHSSYLERTLPGHAVVPVPISATRELIHSIRRQTTPQDCITIIGGGNMGALYPDIEALRQLVIRSFPRNRVVSFPQTLDWDESEKAQRAIGTIVRVYSRHPDLHVFARESVSFDNLRELFAGQPANVGLVPDIVLSATALTLGVMEQVEPSGALLCLRDDRERSLNDQQRDTIKQGLADAGLEAEETDTHAGGSRLPAERCAQLLADKLGQFQGAQLIVTDRLHGMILALLSGTPCLVLPSSNHKIRQTWLDWLAEVPQVRFLSLEELPKLRYAIDDLLGIPRRDLAEPVISQTLFDGLRTAIVSHGP